MPSCVSEARKTRGHEGGEKARKEGVHALKSPSSCKCSSPPNVVVFAFCDVHVVRIVRFVTQVDQEVDVGKSVCVLKSLEDV
jgi:hypothetical protein